MLRPHTPKDEEAIISLVQKAFENEEHSDQQEHLLIQRIWKADHFIPSLSIVAEQEGEILGYILLSEIIIENKETQHAALALAPVAVLPNRQGEGIGGRLIQFAHQTASELGYSSITLLGHPAYYPKFGYKTSASFGIKLPFDVPEEYCMTIELHPNALDEIDGTVKYSKEFEID